MKNAFTMVELIFVIVILGILAAVAIPRLSSTRDDAIVSALAQSITNGIEEISAYAVSQGVTINSMATMSNSFDSLERQGNAVLSDKRAVVKAGSIPDCITIDINTTATSEVLQLSLRPAGGNDPLCTSLQGIIDTTDYPIRLRGQYVIH